MLFSVTCFTLKPCGAFLSHLWPSLFVAGCTIRIFREPLLYVIWSVTVIIIWIQDVCCPLFFLFLFVQLFLWVLTGVFTQGWCPGYHFVPPILLWVLTGVYTHFLFSDYLQLLFWLSDFFRFSLYSSWILFMFSSSKYFFNFVWCSHYHQKYICSSYVKELELPVAATSVGVSYVSQFLFPKNRFHIPVVQINPSSNGWGRILQSYNYYLPLLLLWYLIWKLFPGLMQFFLFPFFSFIFCFLHPPNFWAFFFCFFCKFVVVLPPVLGFPLQLYHNFSYMQ